MLTALQKKVIGTLAKLRDESSYLAGGAMLNLQYPRVSDDLDIFLDAEAPVVRVARRDIEALKADGFHVSDELMEYGFAEVTVKAPEGNAETKVQWMQENAHRFFPLQKDPEFGLRLHYVDLAVNKAVAAASRKKARDIVDLDVLNANYMHLGALVWAASNSKTLMSPVKMLENIQHNVAIQTATNFKMVLSTQPIDGEALIERMRAAHEPAVEFCRAAPVETIGSIFVNERGEPVSPSVEDIQFGKVRPHSVLEHGAWPSFPDA